MVLGAIIDLFGRVLWFFINLLPTSVELPQQINSALDWTFGQAFKWNWIVPVDTILTIAGLAMAFYTGIFAVMGVKWVLNLIRGSGA